MIAAGAVGRAVEDYLSERQRLGYRMYDSELRRFARYADQRNHAGPLDAELQITWARLHVLRTTAGTGTRRLETLRPFVRYYRQFEPDSVEVDPCLLGPKRGRLTPHIYTTDEIDALVRAAARLKPSDALRPALGVRETCEERRLRAPGYSANCLVSDRRGRKARKRASPSP